MYIQATNGFFYENPRIENEKGMLLVVDEESYIIVEEFKASTMDSARRRAVTVTKSLGIKGKLGVVGEKNAFFIRDSLKKAWFFEILLTESIPIPEYFDGKLESSELTLALGNEKIVGFELAFHSQTVEDYIQGKEHRLLEVILGEDGIKEAKKQLKKQPGKVVTIKWKHHVLV